MCFGVQPSGGFCASPTRPRKRASLQLAKVLARLEYEKWRIYADFPKTMESFIYAESGVRDV
jgi:hypothetical protein